MACLLPGFFAKSLAAKAPKGVWMHDWSLPVAKTLEARELPPGDPKLPTGLTALGGLYVKGQFNLETQRGREAFSDIKHGLIDEYSIGYEVTADRKTTDGVRELIEGTLYEWSPVLVGANRATTTLAVKDGKPATADTKSLTGSVEERLARIAAAWRCVRVAPAGPGVAAGRGFSGQCGRARSSCGTDWVQE